MSERLLQTIAKSFALSSEALIEQGLKAFLQDQLALLTAEYQTILKRYEVQTLQELYNIIAQHPEQESDILPDFQRLDFLTLRLQEIKQWLNELNGTR